MARPLRLTFHKRVCGMNFEPQKFFIGLVDFFSIFMPGALLTYLLKDWVAMRFLGLPAGYPLNATEPAIVFFFASYLLGHAAFLLSAILDDWIYDPIRAWTDWGQTKRLADGGQLSPLWQRRLAASKLLFGRGADNAVVQAQRIKARALHTLEAEDAINAFQWCKARLIKDLPEARLAVERFEAASKFFRSLVVVLVTLAVIYAVRGRWLAADLCFAGMLPSLWRYIDQRFKGTQQAYWFVIMLEAKEAKVPAATPRADGLTHAGGIVYRPKGGKIEDADWMLVEASGNRSERVLPKGHIEPGEDPRVTAVREVQEETGHWARVKGWLEDSRLGREASAPRVRWFVLEYVEKPQRWRREERQWFWIPLGKAIDAATFEDTKALLRQAGGNLRPVGKNPPEYELRHQT